MDAPPEDALNVFTDGSWNNEDVAGAGIYISNPIEGDIIDEKEYKRNVGGCEDNNVTEFQAIVFALRGLKFATLRRKKIIIWTDSQLVVAQMAKTFLPNYQDNDYQFIEPAYKKMVKEVKKWVDYFAERRDIQVQFKKVTAHDKDPEQHEKLTEGNKKADVLAKEGRFIKS